MNDENRKIANELFFIAEQSFPIESHLSLDFSDEKRLQEIYQNYQFLKKDKEFKRVGEIKRSELNQLVQRLTDRILLINDGMPSKTKLAKMYYESQKELIVAEILNMLHMKKAALYVAERLVIRCQKYFLLNIAFQAYRIIFTNRFLGREHKKCDQAIEKFKLFLNYYQVEKSIEIERIKLINLSNMTRGASVKKQLNNCTRVLEEYKPYVNKIPSYYFHNTYFLFVHAKFMLLKDYEKVYLNALEANKWFLRLPFRYIPGEAVFIYIELIYLIQARQFSEGRRVLKRAYSITYKGSQQWFRIRENEFILNMHEGNFQAAVEVFFTTIYSKSFDSIIQLGKDRWLLYEAYAHFLIEGGKCSYNGKRSIFKINRYLNSLPNFTASKRARNIPLLIAQMIFMIMRKDYSGAIERIEALEKYSKRYLRNDDTFRSNCFIKMLLEIPKRGFHEVAVKRHTAPLLAKLKSSKIDLINQPMEIEIIPYDMLWDIVLENMSNSHVIRGNQYFSSN